MLQLHIFLRTALVASSLMSVISFCILMYPAMFPYAGTALSMSTAYAVSFSLIALFWSALADELHGLHYYNITPLSAGIFFGLFVALLLLTLYIAWCAFYYNELQALGTQSLILVISSTLTLLASFLCLIVMLCTFIPWFKDT